MKHLSVLFLLLFLLSCQPEVEYEFYGDTNNIKVEKIYRSKDRKKYEMRYYYPNGQLEKKGLIVDYLEEGFWDYYSIDGEKKTSIPYIHGRIDYMNKKRQKPRIVLLDSLKMNTPCKCLVFNLFSGETVTVSNNVQLTSGSVIPIEGDQVVFYYAQRVEKVKIDSSCADTLQSQLFYITKEEMDSSEFYRIATTPIDSFPIYK